MAMENAVMHPCSRRFRVLLLAVPVLWGLIACPPRGAAQNRGPARDAWQHPERVMAALGIHRGSVVADVGFGRGYFTFKFANGVGLKGKVYAVDIREDVLNYVRREAEREKFTQVEAVHGADDDPHLPEGKLDAVLVMNAYHEFVDHRAMLAGILRSLKPGGLLALIDGEAPAGHARDYYDGWHRLPKHFELEEAEQAGFHLLREEPGFTQPDNGKVFYFMLFERPPS